jgi:hypothetical protein
MMDSRGLVGHKCGERRQTIRARCTTWRLAGACCADVCSCSGTGTGSGSHNVSDSEGVWGWAGFWVGLLGVGRRDGYGCFQIIIGSVAGGSYLCSSFGGEGSGGIGGGRCRGRSGRFLCGNGRGWDGGGLK